MEYCLSIRSNELLVFQQHGLSQCSAKEARHKKEHMIWVHLNETLEMTNTLCNDWRQAGQQLCDLRLYGVVDKETEQGNLGNDGNILYVGWGGITVCTGVHTLSKVKF